MNIREFALEKSNNFIKYLLSVIEDDESRNKLNNEYSKYCDLQKILFITCLDQDKHEDNIDTIYEKSKLDRNNQYIYETINSYLHCFYDIKNEIIADIFFFSL